MARSETFSSTIDKDIDHIINRMRLNIPDIPYCLSVPSEHPYRVVDPVLTNQWRVNTWFEPHEEHLQYSTFVWRDPSSSLFRLHTLSEHEVPAYVKMRSDAEPSPSGAPKKKITLAAYKNKNRISEVHGKTRSAHNEWNSSSHTNEIVTSFEEPAPPTNTKRINGGVDINPHQSDQAVTEAGEDKSKKDALDVIRQQNTIDEMSMPWLPRSSGEMASDTLPPRLSPLVAEASILNTPSPSALQRHAISSLSGSTSSPFQISISLPSRFSKDTREGARNNHDTCDVSISTPESKTGARYNSGERRRSSLIVKLRVPLLKHNMLGQKRKPEDSASDALDQKRTRVLHNLINGDNVEIFQSPSMVSASSSQIQPDSPSNSPTITEWQAEGQRLSRLGKRSKLASSETARQAEQTSDGKEQVRLRKRAAVQALESLLLFLQSFIAKTQSRPKLRALLADWVSLLPYSTDVVNLARRFAHLEGLGLLLQSVASSQIVRICNGIRQQQQQLRKSQHDDLHDTNADDKNRDVYDILHTLHKYSFYSQQKAAEADRKLTRKMLSNEYPKAHAASVDQALGGSLQPMPAFRMAVLLLDEWSGHQGVEWQPLDEGLCKVL